MHLPFVFHLGRTPIAAHLVFELLSYASGFLYYKYLRRRQGDVLAEEQRAWVVIGGIAGAAIGSKLLGYFEHPPMQLLSRENVAYFFASKTIVGGLLGGVLGVECVKKRLGVSRSTGDLFCFPLILGMMIGRVGCFLAGVGDGTWGNPTHLPWGMDGGDGVLRHPTPLYEIIVLGAIWWSLAKLKRRVRLREGSLFKLFMASYLAWRFAVEFIKPVYLVEPPGISAIQFACLLGLGYYYKVIFKFSALRAD